MTSELLTSIYITLLISISMVVLVPVFYWLFTTGRDWQQRHV